MDAKKKKRWPKIAKEKKRIRSSSWAIWRTPAAGKKRNGRTILLVAAVPGKRKKGKKDTGALAPCSGEKRRLLTSISQGEEEKKDWSRSVLAPQNENGCAMEAGEGGGSVHEARRKKGVVSRRSSALPKEKEKKGGEDDYPLRAIGKSALRIKKKKKEKKGGK